METTMYAFRQKEPCQLFAQHRIFLTGMLFSFAFLVGCNTPAEQTPDNVSDPVSRGDRILVIDVNEAEKEEYAEVVARSQSVGANRFNLSIQWDELETSPETYEPIVDLLTIANSYYPGIGAQVSLMIGPIDTNNDRRPADLKGKAFDDPVVIQRFRALLDYVFTQIPDLDLSVLSIGNEVDALLGVDQDAWRAYTNFFQATMAYAKQLRQGLNVGVKVTHNGLTGAAANFARTLNEESDAILTTYYPLKADFTVEDASVVGEAFNQVSSQYQTRAIWFMELGYPSSTTCNSSEEKQAEFIRESFKAWDNHHEQIMYISFSIMSDRSQESVDVYSQYYGVSDVRFLEFLRTLGLRTWSEKGQDKKGWIALKEEAMKRGW